MGEPDRGDAAIYGHDTTEAKAARAPAMPHHNQLEVYDKVEIAEDKGETGPGPTANTRWVNHDEDSKPGPGRAKRQFEIDGAEQKWAAGTVPLDKMRTMTTGAAAVEYKTR